MKFRYAAFAAAVVAAGVFATPAAAARGCNGVVNPLVWGCAPWDNNNGPQFPYFKKKQVPIPRAQAQVFNERGVQMVRDLRSGAVYPLIGQAAGNLIGTAAHN